MEPTSDEALLIAYLDGELTPQDRQHLEQRLASEPELRQRLILLEETWDYLGLLEQESPNIEQIETTLKTAALSISASPLVSLKANQSRKWGIVAVAGIVLFAVAFHFGSQPFLDDPSFRQMIKRYDMYLYLVLSDDGFDLLRELTVKRVFLPPLPEDVQSSPDEYQPNRNLNWMPGALAHWTIHQRDELDDPELYRLFYKNLQKFRTLSPEKSQQVHKLHQSIEKTPGQVELVITLQNYYHWLKSLQPYEKAALKRLQRLDEKVESIVALKKHLDARQLDDAVLMPSEIISIEESQRLAETLSDLPPWQQEGLLNNGPIQIINELKHSLSSEEKVKKTEN